MHESEIIKEVFEIQNLIDNYEPKSSSDYTVIRLIELHDSILKKLKKSTRLTIISRLISRDYPRSILTKAQIKDAIISFLSSNAIRYSGKKRGRPLKHTQNVIEDEVIKIHNKVVNEQPQPTKYDTLPPEMRAEIQLLLDNGFEEEEINQKYNLA